MVGFVSVGARVGTKQVNGQGICQRRDGAPRAAHRVLVMKQSGGNGQPKKQKVVAAGKVCVIGLSHHTATVEVREKLAVPEADWQSVARDMCELAGVSEAAVLSTCNRFEVYFVAEDSHQGIFEVSNFLSKRSGVPVVELRKFLFLLTEEDCIWHMLRVSAGLDSLVVGEGQILSQVRRCYELATESDGAAGKVLGKFLNTAVAAGKRARSETDIARGAVSISSAAVELAEMKSMPDLNKHLRETKICILGAGKMSRLLVQHLLSREVTSITIVNRSLERAEDLARMFPDAPIELRTMGKMLECIEQSDITFASTGAQEPILFKENLAPVAGDEKKVLIDISVPLNVAADVSEIETIAAYNVDDLKAVVAKNQARRRALIIDAENLLREEQKTFTSWLHSIGTVPYITRLQTRAEAIRAEELDRVMGKLSNLSKSELLAVEKLSKGIVNKMLHGPMSHIKELADVEERKLVLKNLEAMFKLGA
uniref:Glutamyl-tRNA reductase n=1 Tax=Rhodosorus marinus TaxID=101924 RepID=A0A7S3A106_9RHOD|mmetsp:Transcript_40630/g.161115  ORF Transcript_40630/g.161115 Transcript_40630/m.161115 type:complete len:483 (+) Transcript_40630:89-1537(+)